MAKSLDLVLKFGLHAQLVDVDLIEYFEEFGDQLLLADVLIFAVTISRPRTPVVDVMRRRAVSELLVLVFCRDAGLA